MVMQRFIALFIFSIVCSINAGAASPNDEVADVMCIMTERRIRHVPVVERGHLVGIVSIGDTVKAQHDELCRENHYLKSYIQS